MSKSNGLTFTEAYLHAKLADLSMAANAEGVQRLLVSNEQLRTALSDDIGGLARRIGSGLSRLGERLDDGFAELSRKLESPNELVAAEYYRNAVAAARRDLVPEALSLVNKALFGDGLKTSGHSLSWQFHMLRGRLLIADQARAEGVFDAGEAEKAFRMCARIATSESRPDAAWALYFAAKAMEAASSERKSPPDNAALQATYRAALELDSTLVEASFEEARIMVRLGDKSEAFRRLEVIARARPEFLLQAYALDEFSSDAAEWERFLVSFRETLVSEIQARVRPLLDEHAELVSAYPALGREGVAAQWRAIAEGALLPGAVDISAYCLEGFEHDVEAFRDDAIAIQLMQDEIRATRLRVKGEVSEEATEVLARWERVPGWPLERLLGYVRGVSRDSQSIIDGDSTSGLDVGDSPDQFAWVASYRVDSDGAATVENDLRAFEMPVRLECDAQVNWYVADSFGARTQVLASEAWEEAWEAGLNFSGSFSGRVSQPVTNGFVAVVNRALLQRAGQSSGQRTVRNGDPSFWALEEISSFCNRLSEFAGRTPAYDANRSHPDESRDGFRVPLESEVVWIRNEAGLTNAAFGACLVHRHRLLGSGLRGSAPLGIDRAKFLKQRPHLRLFVTEVSGRQQRARRLAVLAKVVAIVLPLVLGWRWVVSAGDKAEPAVMKSIPGGAFIMGSPQGELGRESSEPSQLSATVNRAFLIGQTEVTQGEWKALSGGTNPACFQSTSGTECTGSNDNDGGPVEQLDWYSAVAFANAKSAAEGLPTCYSLSGCSDEADGWKDGQHDGCSNATFAGTGCTGYRLPTAAEWEYAARAGTTTATYNGDLDVEVGTSQVLDSIAWYDQNSLGRTHAVGSKSQNAWELRDMIGNVNEWISDADAGGGRMVRGGSWSLKAGLSRAARSMPLKSGQRDSRLGFRLVKSVP